jgi:hypothetical protein
MTDESPKPVVLPDASAADAIEFAQGALDAVCAICASIIGRGLAEPSAFQDNVKRYAEHWHNKARPNRALAADIVHARLQTIEAAKLKANAHLVVPENKTTN